MLVANHGKVFYVKNIEMQDSIYYGFIAKEKIVISEATLSEIYLQDKRKSFGMTLLGITIPIIVFSVVMLILFVNALDDL